MNRETFQEHYAILNSHRNAIVTLQKFCELLEIKRSISNFGWLLDKQHHTE
jgi:hypothetical protein